MEVVHDPLVASDSVIIGAVSDIGYGAEVWKTEVVKAEDGGASKQSDVRTVQILVEGFCEYVPFLHALPVK